ncbi:MAG: lamin tail domain-containing protein [Hyphomicrobiaceae bacterium]|nr:lamin tail domain-containing protein [Hyphomicrobiaceae bacterium]
MIDNVCIYDRALDNSEIAQLADSDYYWSRKEYWRPSAAVDGSPGEDDTGDFPAERGAVIINEVLAHSDFELYDWIELYNTTGADINIGGWFLSDSDVDFKKFEIPQGNVIEANGYIAFTQNEFGTPGAPGCITPFALSENGEKLFLHSGQAGEITGYAEERSFGASDPDVSMGLYIIPSNGEVEFVAMSQLTEGTPNAYPKVGSVVISEIIDHPIDGDAEYIELFNTTGGSVTLYDSVRAMPWRVEGIGDFDIFTDTGAIVTMGPQERILLVNDKTAFAGEFTPEPGTRIIQWLSGSLQNGGETISLVKPGDYNTASELQYIVVDEAGYSDGTHPEGNRPDLWPTEPDGGIDTNDDGFPDKSIALKRNPETNYGNDPTNWQAADPSPGS